MKRLTEQQLQRFRKIIYSHFERHGRSLPWRRTTNPYHILVSEIMLQQTQVDRVIPKYDGFIEVFPSARELARAPLSKVLWTWSGLGYNRRAVSLKKCAQEIMRTHKGQIPNTIKELDALPGIGCHTAGAIMAFAFNKPVVFIETNVRSVFLHHFFPKRKKVSDSELEPLIEQALDRQNPRKWYSALMDYGSVLKKEVENPSRRSKHHTKQSRFEGSNRQLRGAILKALIIRRSNTAELQRALNRKKTELNTVLSQLQKEGLICNQEGVFGLPF
ncbi:MAG: A/G-specific adenine glycosylase [Candidatus Komeilibacteria bacterium]|nr:A/G-specific adenine glycosylase [Candidatus Komeilibacteria bacterium]